MKKPPFITGEFYHLYNRGVEKRSVFMNNADFFRFIHGLFEFNDEHAALNLFYKLPDLKSYEVEPRKISKRKILVEIVAFCLMPNHYHLLIRQRRDMGVVRFMQKLGTGYTMYFNKKYERVGSLFQGRFKAIAIRKDHHLQYLPHYIHLNPLDLKMPSWREGNIPNLNKAFAFLNSYRWSSYLDCVGKKNFPSIISRSLFQNLYGTPKEYKKSLHDWIRNMNIEALDTTTLE